MAGIRQLTKPHADAGSQRRLAESSRARRYSARAFDETGTLSAPAAEHAVVGFPGIGIVGKAPDRLLEPTWRCITLSIQFDYQRCCHQNCEED